MQNMDGKTALGLDQNVGAMLCYMPLCAIGLIFSIIVLITDKTNKLVRFHAFQSLLLTAAYIVILMVFSFIVGIIAGATGSSVIISIASLLPMIFVFAFIALMIYGCVKGFQGQMFKLPVIGDMADKWSN